MAETVSPDSAPVVGVAACIFKENKILLGRRKKSPGMNGWQCPGGLLEKSESVFECARRLVLRKAGLNIHRLHYGPYTNNRFTQEDFHSVTLYVSAEYLSGEIDSSGYRGADEWQWFSLDKFPEPLFLPLRILHEKHRGWLSSLE
jgi:8-oxo-dGTP diphosphatase